MSSNKSEYLHADAILFHNRDFNWAIPPRRTPTQRYIFMLYESPPHAGDLTRISGRNAHFFNWTMTYRRHSDIEAPSFRVVKKETHVSDSAWRQVGYAHTLAHTHIHMQEAQSMIANKSKSIAWFVSNCRTHSKREVYVTRMQKLIDIDVYGSCGTLKCDENKDKCNEKLQRDYWWGLLVICFCILFNTFVGSTSHLKTAFV
jgi:alpha-1,3-fucosyltransferase